MAVTLEQIKSLRERTGISTMACKKALEEAGGDESKAIDMLRKKGAAKAAERSERTTANGTIAIAQGDGKVAMLTLACETDFVAKNEDFVKAAQGLAEKILAEGEDADLSKEISDLTIQLGEKIDVAEKKVLEGEHVYSYLHMNGKIGVLVGLSEGSEEVGKDVAMHVAAMNPANLSPDDVADEIIAKEKEIWTDQLKEEGKPEEIIGKIMMGKEKKFREESALLTQAFVKNPEQLIQDLLGSAKVVEFVRFAV